MREFRYFFPYRLFALLIHSFISFQPTGNYCSRLDSGSFCDTDAFIIKKDKKKAREKTTKPIEYGLL